MRYKELEINRFRGIKKIEFSDFRNINLIVGRNNSSKTSILESLFVLTGSLSPEIILRINLFRNLKFIEQEDLRLVFNALKYDEDIHIKAIGFNEEKRELTISPGSKDVKTQTLSKDVNNRSLNDLDYNSFSSVTNINELTFRTTVKERHSPEKKAVAKIYFQNGEFLTENGILKSKINDRAVYVTQYLDLSSNLEKELENLIITKQHMSIVDALKSVDVNIVNISLGHNRMIYADIGLDRLIPINLLGDGVRRLLAIILAIHNSKDGIVLIDEIDNGLHYSTLKSLWKSVLYISKQCNVQVFVTTHNYETIKYLSECLVEAEYEIYKDTVKTYTVRKLQNGEHKSYGYDFEQFSNAINEDIELR
ncbi:AAA family ATPase [Flavobacterium sp. XS2P24]|uniref:AAA family ATPase n=1 Tax=Flavobacterium sp. XS2P24 TaxID=3041249 RepID=UPI0024A94155|nr:ATP-binding protein [Flavobacterium sp. XS2P24]MDI6049806.1 AAA family ATPase [Flavobacterium sp. XS2P24]